MKWFKQNYGSLIVLLIIIVLVITSIINIRKAKGKCAYCSHYDTCPFKKKNVDN